MGVRIRLLNKSDWAKELLELLKSRGFVVKSVSSTIDNISADSIIEEFAAQNTDTAEPDEAASAEAEAPKGPSLPEGVIVRSAADIEREKKEAEEAKELEKVLSLKPSRLHGQRKSLPPRPTSRQACWQCSTACARDSSALHRQSGTT